MTRIFTFYINNIVPLPQSNRVGVVVIARDDQIWSSNLATVYGYRVGISFRNIKDAFNKKLGRRIALGRAGHQSISVDLDHLIEDMTLQLYEYYHTRKRLQVDYIPLVEHIKNILRKCEK